MEIKMKDFYQKGKLILLFLVFGILMSGCTDGNETAPMTSGESGRYVQEKAEASSLVEFEGQDIDGNTITSDIFSESKLTMLNVWATYCNPCLSEMPGLGELADSYASDEFQIIGIVSDVMEGGDETAVDQARALIDQTGANYTHLLLNESIYHALLTNVSAVPTTFFVDETGAIMDIVVGAMEKDAWKEKIDELLEDGTDSVAAWNADWTCSAGDRYRTGTAGRYMEKSHHDLHGMYRNRVKA